MACARRILPSLPVAQRRETTAHCLCPAEPNRSIVCRRKLHAQCQNNKRDLWCARSIYFVQKSRTKNTESVHCVRCLDSRERYVYSARLRLKVHAFTIQLWSHSLAPQTPCMLHCAHAILQTIDVGLVCVRLFHFTEQILFAGVFSFASFKLFSNHFSSQFSPCRRCSVAGSPLPPCVSMFLCIFTSEIGFISIQPANNLLSISRAMHISTSPSTRSYLVIYANHCLSLHVSQMPGLGFYTMYLHLLLPPKVNMHSANNRFEEKHLPGLEWK